MLKTRLLHPEILRALAGAGHSSQVLIADGNYPVATHAAPHAARVYLNLAPGLLSCTDVLDVLVDTIPIEEATVMEAPADQAVPIHEEFRRRLPADAAMRGLERFAFYDAVRSPATALVIATGERRRYANLLLSIGVVKLEAGERY